jgi:hypothetical protein
MRFIGLQSCGRTVRCPIAPTSTESWVPYTSPRGRRVSRLLMESLFVGDVHGERSPLLRALDRSPGPAPRWLVFVGDLDLDVEAGSFDDLRAPLVIESS